MPVVPAIWEVEVGGSPEPGKLSLQWFHHCIAASAWVTSETASQKRKKKIVRKADSFLDLMESTVSHWVTQIINKYMSKIGTVWAQCAGRAGPRDENNQKRHGRWAYERPPPKEPSTCSNGGRGVI